MTIPHDATKERIFKEIASVLFLHDEAHHEQNDGKTVFRCECGISSPMDNEDQFKSVLARHQSEMLADEVKKIAATAWDEGWFAGCETEDPAMAGIFINPYRSYLANFDPNRITS